MLEPQEPAVAAVDSLAVAREHLLEANGISLATLDRALGAALTRQLDYADLYLQLTRYETWTVEDGIVKEGSYSIDEGVGVRAVSGERTGFAYSDQLDEESLQDAVAAARGIARAQGSGKIKVARPVLYRPLYSRHRAARQHQRRREGAAARGSRPADAGHGQARHRRSSRASPAFTRSCSFRPPMARWPPTCGRSCG